MSASSTIPRRAALLDSSLDGKVVLPGDERFDGARRAWNLAIDQRPAAVVFPESAAEVVAAVGYAAERGLRIAAQGTGHNARPLGSLTDTVLLRTEKMRGIRIDPQARTATVEAGVIWLDVVQAAAEHGLAALAGSSPDVGVVGYTLGGGLSFLGRKYGLAANNVAAAEVATADGRLVRADREHEPDLFWALRGGGGSFGIVTALEFQLFPVTGAYAGVLWYPIERASEVLHAWGELTRGQVPDELTTVGRLLNFPPIPQIPEQVRGKSFVIVEACHTGDPAQADALLAPLRRLGPVNDTVAAVQIPELIHLHMDPEQPVPATGEGMMLGRLPGEAIDAIAETAGAGAAFPLLSVELRHLGGEFARSRPGNGALACLDAHYVVFAVGMTPVPELVAPVTAQVEAVKGALAPWAARQMCLNFAENRRDPASFWNPHAYDRLRRIKAAVDPHNLIHANHPIPPAPPCDAETPMPLSKANGSAPSPSRQEGTPTEEATMNAVTESSLSSRAAPTVAGLHHLGLTVRDIAASEAWYTQVLGLVRVFVEPHGTGDGYAVVMTRPGTGLFVGLDHHPGADREMFSALRTGLDHLALALATREDLDEWITHLDAVGVEHGEVFQSAESAPHALVVFRDPDGIPIELFWYGG